jgi:hypothetical protein
MGAQKHIGIQFLTRQPWTIEFLPPVTETLKLESGFRHTAIQITPYLSKNSHSHDHRSVLLTPRSSKRHLKGDSDDPQHAGSRAAHFLSSQ